MEDKMGVGTELHKEFIRAKLSRAFQMVKQSFCKHSSRTTEESDGRGRFWKYCPKCYLIFWPPSNEE